MIGVPLGPERAAWRAVLFAQNALVRILDDELQRECGMPLQVYDVLIRIWLAPEHTLRMSELAESALLSRSWITRRVDRLERSGLVERHFSSCVTADEALVIARALNRVTAAARQLPAATPGTTRPGRPDRRARAAAAPPARPRPCRPRRR